MSHLLFIKTLPQQLGQPTTIAVVASLGIHVVLGLTLPNMSTASKQEGQNPRGNVKVVELSPAEESRVPSLAPSPPSVLPSLASESQQLPPLPPPPSISYPPLPSISYPPLPSYPSTSLPKPDNLSLAPKGTKSSKSSKGTKAQTTKGQLGKGAGMFDNFQIYEQPIFKQQQRSSNPKPNKSSDRQPIAYNNSPGLKPADTTPFLGVTTPPPPLNNGPLPPPPPIGSNQPQGLPSMVTPAPLPPIGSNQPQGLPSMVTPAPLPLISSNQPQGLPSMVTPAPLPPISSNQPQQSANNATAKSPQPGLLALQERLREMRQQYAYNPEGTSDGEAAKNGGLWRDRVKKAYPNLTKKSVITESIDYPREMSCPKNEPQAAEVIVVVDREGKIVDGPELTRSTGYSILDKAVKNALTGALDEARKRDRPQTGENEYTAYPFRFKVNKASCRSGQQPISMSAK